MSSLALFICSIAGEQALQSGDVCGGSQTKACSAVHKGSERYDNVNRKDKVRMIYGRYELNVVSEPFLVRFVVFKRNLCVSKPDDNGKR